MTYGSERWNLTKKQTIKLRTTQRSHEKKTLGITWKHKKRAKWIREQTKLQDIVRTIKMLKWNWAGHIMRTNDNRWTKRLIEWTPCDQKRKPGKPNTRWRDELFKFNSNWTQESLDREKWRKLGKVFLLQWSK